MLKNFDIPGIPPSKIIGLNDLVLGEKYSYFYHFGNSYHKGKYVSTITESGKELFVMRSKRGDTHLYDVKSLIFKDLTNDELCRVLYHAHLHKKEEARSSHLMRIINKNSSGRVFDEEMFRINNLPFTEEYIKRRAKRYPEDFI